MIYPVDYDPLLPAFTTHVILVLHPRAVDYPGVTQLQDVEHPDDLGADRFHS